MDKGRVLGKQLLRCGTSAGANYRSACRGRPTAEFVAKLGIVLEQTDGVGFWIELIVEGNRWPDNRCSDLHKEADELCAIISSTIRSSRESGAR